MSTSEAKNIGLSGVGNDLIHQLIISCLLYSFMEKCKKKTYNGYLPLPEFSIKQNDTKDFVPDISVWKLKRKKLFEPIIVIEICRTDQINKEIKKMSKMFNSKTSLEEGFIIDKDKLEVKKIIRNSNKKASKPKKSGYSDKLKIELDNILRDLPKVF